MHVQKTVQHNANTITHGSFHVRETVHVCALPCRHPNGALVTRRARALEHLLLPHRTVSYDVMVYVGTARLLQHRQRDEVREALRAEHGVALSCGTVSDLARLFGQYLRALQDSCADKLRAALESDGGYPLHIDATGENGRGTLLVGYAGWRRWVLGAWKIPTERADVVFPRLREVVGRFGPPCAIVRDLGKAMISAAADLVAQLHRPIPILACHAHFLADVGEDLLEPSHDALRKLFRHQEIRPELRAMAREIGQSLGAQIAQVREAVQNWHALEDGEHTLPEGRAALGVVRSMAQWVLDYAADSTGADFPFDRPYLDLYDRSVRVRRALDAFLRKPPEDKPTHRALRRLARILEPVSREPAFSRAATTLRRRAALFDELRTALRLHPSDSGTLARSPAAAQHELRDVQAAVHQLALSLHQRRPARGPAEDTRQAIDVVLAHLDRHGSSLWGHAVPLPAAAGGGIRLVARTNNLLEGFNRALKQGERRRSGRKTLSDDFEHLPAEAALARNLLCPDYVEIVCGSLDQLPRAFAELDADRRCRTLATTKSLPAPPQPDTSEIASASLPKEDRRLVRSDAISSRILAAARSRAPRISVASARC